MDVEELKDGITEVLAQPLAGTNFDRELCELTRIMGTTKNTEYTKLQGAYQSRRRLGAM